MKKIILTLLITIFSWAGEPSVFEAGNLNNNNPYGLTPDEQHIYNNKINIKKLQKIIKVQQQLIKTQQKELQNLKLQFVKFKMIKNNLSQRVAGIETILPSFDKTMSDVAVLKTEFNQTKTSIQNLDNNLTVLKTNFNNYQTANDKHINTLIGLIEQLAKSIDKLQKAKTIHKKDFRSLPKNKILSEAINDFKNRKFNLAKMKFNYLYNKKYKMALDMFYLGEIVYKMGEYKLSLAYYKKSITLNSKKTFYMPELLYHSGYAFERIGDKNIAKQTYEKIIIDFPNSIFVKYAEKRLHNLKNNK